jgi:hypothetical protein
MTDNECHSDGVRDQAVPDDLPHTHLEPVTIAKATTEVDC